MTSQKLHIHSIVSSGTPLSSSSTSDFDDELYSDRELPTGPMFEMLIVSGLFVGLQEDFASKLRKEFLSAGGLRIPPSDETQRPYIDEQHVVIERKPVSITNPKSPDEIQATLPNVVISSRDPVVTNETQDIPFLPLKSTPSVPQQSSGYASRSWGFMTGVASACVTKFMTFGT
jgi:hypothetical protein